MPNLNWSELQLLESSIINSVPSVSGVYRLSYKSADGPYYVFYVGQADNLKERLMQHLNGTNTNSCVATYIKNLKCYFVYTAISETNLKKDTERTIYDHFKPKCNIQLPEGNRIDINYN